MKYIIFLEMLFLEILFLERWMGFGQPGSPLCFRALSMLSTR